MPERIKTGAFTVTPEMTMRPDGRRENSDLVMVHGLALSGRYLRPSARRLGVDRRVLIPDRPGVGRSGQSRALTAGDLADGLADWMSSVGITSADVMGRSVGCQVVAELAARYPKRVRKLVFVSPARDPDHRAWAQRAWRILVDARRERPSLLGIAVVDYVRAGPTQTVRVLRAARRADVTDILRTVAHPSLVLVGGRDPVVSPEWAATFADALPHGALVTVPGAPHGLPYSCVDEFVTHVRRFLR